MGVVQNKKDREIEMGTQKDRVILRIAEMGDVKAARDLMRQTDLSMEGLSSMALFDVLCHDALSNGNVVIVVAAAKGALAGYVIAIVDYSSYWKAFIRRHLLISLDILTHKLIRKIRTKRITTENKKWKDSSPHIAKIINIAVLPEHRGSGIGKGLYTYLFGLLRDRGVRRIDANINSDNAPSIKLHTALGWKIEKKTGNLFATIDI